jgi:replication factor A1
LNQRISDAFLTLKLTSKEPKRLTPKIQKYSARRGPSWNKSPTYRGRPRGKSKSHYVYLNSIVSIAHKQGLEPKQLATAFVDAVDEEVAHYGDVTIRCRGIHHSTATILIEKDENVVWQFPVDLESIRDPHLQEHLKTIPIKHTKNRSYSKTPKISGLRYGMKKLDVMGRITKKPPTKHVNTRWGSQASVSNVTITDETGSIRLSLWNDQIHMVQIDDKIELKNCYVSRFAGESQLRIGRKGTITVINPQQHEEPMPFAMTK